MPLPKWIQWSGVAAMLGGLLLISKSLIDIRWGRDPYEYYPAGISDYLMVAVGLLWMVAVAGLYVRYAELSKTTGAAGLNVLFVGTTLIALSGSRLFWEADPLLMLGLIAMSVGIVIFDIIQVRAKTLPRWASLFPFIIGASGMALVAQWLWAVEIVPANALYMLLGAGWVPLGSVLWRKNFNGEKG